MKLFALLPVLTGLALVTPTFAHQGIIHEGCPTGQVFTAGDLTITGAYTRATPPSAKVGGGYLVIENKGTAPDTLLGGVSEAAKAVEVHKMEMVGDVMKMGAVEGGLEIPAGGSVALTPGAYHLMMMGLIPQLKEGQCLQLTLHFAKAGNVPIILNVGGMGSDTAPDGTVATPADGAMDMPMDHAMDAPAQ